MHYKHRDTTLIKPISRKWIPVGMLVGFILAILCYSLPEPIRSFTLWVGCSAGIGSIGTLSVFTRLVGFSRLQTVPTKVWWILIWAGPIIGAIVGFVLFVRGAKLHEDWNAGIGITGVLIGYAVVEIWIKKVDRDRSSYDIPTEKI